VRQAEAYLHTSFCCHWQGKEIDAVEHIQRALKCIENRPEETALLARAYAPVGSGRDCDGRTGAGAREAPRKRMHCTKKWAGMTLLSR